MDNQVTQADREAAAGYLEEHESPLHEHPLQTIIDAMRAGEVDDNTLVQAFAAHRLRHTEAAMPNSVVEALRGIVAEYDTGEVTLGYCWQKVRALATLTQQSPSEGFIITSLAKELADEAEAVVTVFSSFGKPSHDSPLRRLADKVIRLRAHLKDTTNEQD